MKKVIIFRSRLLPKSETFIRSQTKGIDKFKVTFLGITKVVNGILPKSDNVICLNEGGTLGYIKEIAYKLLRLALLWSKGLRNTKHDLIHAHFGPDGYLAIPLATNLDIPLIVTFHGYDATVTGEAVKKSFLMHRIFYRNRSKLFDKASLIISVSDYIKKRVIEIGAPEEKVIRHYIGIDIDKFRYNPYDQHDGDILFVGRLTEKKGLNYLIQAYMLLGNDYPYKLKIIGEGKLMKSLNDQAGANKNIVFMGAKNHEEVLNEISRAKILCLPSVTAKSGDSEGLPIVILESMALGTPVISTYHSGIPEAIEHNHTGILTQERDVNALSKSIAELIEDFERSNELSLNARKKVENEFSLLEQNKKLEELYIKVINE